MRRRYARAFRPGLEHVAPNGTRWLRVCDKRGRKVWHYHVTKRKHQMRLQVWQTECAECGELFTIKVSPYRELPGEFGLTRCKAHRGTLEEINKRKQFERDLRSREALELLGAGHSVAAVHLATGVPVPTLYRWRKGDDHGN